MKANKIKDAMIVMLCMFSSVTYCQRHASGYRSGNTLPEDFIGNWELVKLADKHLNYLTTPVGKKFIKFTNDSVFVSAGNQQYAGTWHLKAGQTTINIRGTVHFNYKWIAKDKNGIFFTTAGLGYYEYFHRTK